MELNNKSSETVNPIDPDKVTDIPGLLHYAHHIGSALIRPDNTEAIKNNAVQVLLEQTDARLDQIREQIELLAKQAADIAKRREISLSIYNASMRFKPVVGRVYYLYIDQSRQHILSMIGPEEWGRRGMPYQEYLHAVKLLGDHTWDILK